MLFSACPRPCPEAEMHSEALGTRGGQATAVKMFSVARQNHGFSGANLMCNDCYGEGEGKPSRPTLPSYVTATLLLFVIVTWALNCCMTLDIRGKTKVCEEEKASPPFSHGSWQMCATPDDRRPETTLYNFVRNVYY